MPKLNFYDTDAVKAFTLDVLVEGAETRRDLDFERRQSAAAWETAREQRTRADKADAAIAAAISTLSNLLEARKNGVEVGWRDVCQNSPVQRHKAALGRRKDELLFPDWGDLCQRRREDQHFLRPVWL